MKKWIILECLLCLLIIASCNRPDESPVLEKGIAVITGKVSNLGQGTKAIRFSASSTIEDIEKTAIIDSKGNFRLEISLYHPQNVEAYFKKGLIRLYIKPSDSILLDIDEALFSKEDLPEFGISGTRPDSEISKEIQQYFKYHQGDYSYPNEKGKSIKEYLQELQLEISRQDSILQKFTNEYGTSKEFNDWAKTHIKYDIANWLLHYRISNPNYEGNLFDKSIFPINDEKAIISSSYHVHLNHYALNIGPWEDSITRNHLSAENYVEAYEGWMGAIIDSVEKGISRDLMCYNIMSGLLNKSITDYEIVSQNIDRYLDNETLRKVLLEKEIDNKNQKMLNISFLDPHTDEEKEITGDFWTELKEKHNGKVMYIDIWATWCGPCRGEIMHAIELHDYFVGQDIAFVNLCLSSNEHEWQKMIKNNNIIGSNYFFNEAQTNLLRDKLQVSGYPTYMIIDKNGNIVDKNAPRPSSRKEIRNLISYWIDKDTY